MAGNPATYMGGACPPSHRPKSQGLRTVSIKSIYGLYILWYSLSSAKKFPRDIFWALDLAGAGGGKSLAVLNHYNALTSENMPLAAALGHLAKVHRRGLHEPIFAVRRGQETRQRTCARFSHRRVWRERKEKKNSETPWGEVQKPCRTE